MTVLASETSQDTRISLPRTTTILRNIDKLSSVTQTIIDQIPTQSEDERLKTRQKSKLLGKTAWRIECACDAEEVDSCVRLKGGRGVRDSEGKGFSAALRRRAKAIGITPNCIQTNARIHRLIESSETVNSEKSSLMSVLDEKGYYHAALSCVNPEETLVLLANHKRLMSRFRVTDAFRLVESLGLTKKISRKQKLKAKSSDETTRALQEQRQAEPENERDADIAHYSLTVSVIKKYILPQCTNDDMRRIHSAYLEELEDFVQTCLFDEDVSKALVSAWEAGHRSENEMSKATGFPVTVVTHEMEMLGNLGQFIKVPPTDVNHGTQVWHKVGKPLPPELRRK